MGGRLPLEKPSRLPERHAEKNLHRQASLDRRIAVVGLSTAFAGRHSLPCHGGIKLDRKRATALERFVIGWPIPGLVGGGHGSAHAHHLPHWIHEMNPSRDLCNRADLAMKRALLHKASDVRSSPFPRRIHPTVSVTGMPSAV